ncbi:MAG: transglycosylase domain-containing protein [Tissierellia bacterium]|nr:transglycosylase domain-containing protein [Tissierellia bacterium]
MKLQPRARKTWWKIGGLIVLILVVILCSMAAALVVGILQDAPPAQLHNLNEQLAQTSALYDGGGNYLESIDNGEYREIVPLSQVPRHVQEAFLSIEDRAFYDHGGLDLRQIFASLRANLQSGEVVRGGSTISQQLVKNMFLTSQQSLSRKLQEAYLTLGLEQNLTKDEIFEAYLNRVDFGFGSYGIEAAAQGYFSKSVGELTVEEGALLAGIVKSTAQYQPIKRIPISDLPEDTELLDTMQVGGVVMGLVENPKAYERKDLVLHTMVQGGYLTEEEAREAQMRPIELRPHIPEPSGYSTYVTDTLKQEAILALETAGYSPEDAERTVLNGGLKIHSTLDGALQQDLDQVYRNYAPLLLDPARGKGAQMEDLQLDEDDNLLDPQGRLLYFSYGNTYDEEGNLILPPDVYSENAQGIILPATYFDGTAPLSLRDAYTISGENHLMVFSFGNLPLEEQEYQLREEGIFFPQETLEAHPDLFSRQDGLLVLSASYGNPPEFPSLQPASSSIIIDHKTGGVLAFTGGIDVDNAARLRLNYLHSLRQPGNALAPLSVYYPALASGQTLASAYDDSPLNVHGEIWPSGTYFRGYSLLYTALVESLDAVSGKILEELGLEASLGELEKFGIGQESLVTSGENEQRNDYTLDALAGGNLVRGITLPQLAYSYSILATDGAIPQLHFIQRIEDPQGEILYQAPEEARAVELEEESLALLRYALMDGKFAATTPADDFSVLGQNKFNSDYWSICANDEFTVASWIGNDAQGLAMVEDEGAVLDFFASIYRLRDSQGEMELPQNWTQATVSSKTGLLATTAAYRSGTVLTLPFVPGTEPKEYTENYVRKLICSTSGELVTQYCPDEEVVSRYFFQRPDDYDPEEHGGIRPEDYLSGPWRYCSVHTKEWYEEQQELEDEDDDDDDRDREDDD